MEPSNKESQSRLQPSFEAEELSCPATGSAVSLFQADSWTSSLPGFTWLHLKVLVAIERCRTAAMGGHLDQCSGCGHRAISYNSCPYRHCPKCQSQVRDRRLPARRAE